MYEDFLKSFSQFILPLLYILFFKYEAKNQKNYSLCEYKYQYYFIHGINLLFQLEDTGAQRTASNLLANLQERIVHTDHGSVIMGGAVPTSTTTGKCLAAIM